MRLSCGKSQDNTYCLFVKSAAEKEEFATRSLIDDGVFRIAKQKDRANQEIPGEICVRNDANELAILDSDKLKAWVERVGRLLNGKLLNWPSQTLPKTASMVAQPLEFSRQITCMALIKMKRGKQLGRLALLLRC